MFLGHRPHQIDLFEQTRVVQVVLRVVFMVQPRQVPQRVDNQVGHTSLDRLDPACTSHFQTPGSRVDTPRTDDSTLERSRDRRYRATAIVTVQDRAGNDYAKVPAHQIPLSHGMFEQIDRFDQQVRDQFVAQDQRHFPPKLGQMRFPELPRPIASVADRLPVDVVQTARDNPPHLDQRPIAGHLAFRRWFTCRLGIVQRSRSFGHEPAEQ